MAGMKSYQGIDDERLVNWPVWSAFPQKSRNCPEMKQSF